jgi:hypothetical protein
MNTRAALVIGFVLGATLIAVWWYYHTHCAACQQRWKLWKNKLGSRLIEPKP